MNGVDAVVIATGNDFRAVEAGVDAFAARDGHYASLSKATIEGDDFCFELTLPLAIGTVGGPTQVAPACKMVDGATNPSAKELMQIMVVAGHKTCRCTFVGHFWHSKRAYENASFKHFKPIECQC